MEKSKLPETKLVKSSFQPIFLAICLVALGCLAFSYFAEFWAYLKPCRLCLIQRYVYFALLLLGSLGYMLKWKETFRKATLLILLTGLSVAAYHSMLQLGITSSKCSSKVIVNDEASFMQGLSSASSCTEKASTLFGLPIPFVNVCIYLSFSVILGSRKRVFTNAKVWE